MGNVVPSLVDPAQNGFFHLTERVPVGVALVRCLILPGFWRVPRTYRKASLARLGAPLRFSDLARPGGLGVWGLRAKGARSSRASPEALGPAV